MKSLALFAVTLTLFGASVSGQTIDPSPLKVHQVCGQAFAAHQRIEIRHSSHGDPLAVGRTDSDGRFTFPSVAEGKIYLAMPGMAISDWYPLEVVKPLAAPACKHPLYVRLTAGSESGIIVSFKR